MQRGRSALNSFPELLDLNQASPPENTSMDHSPSWNDTVGVNDGNVSCTNAAHGDLQCPNRWERGETSSSANNVQDEDSKTRLGWFSSSNASSMLESRPVDWSSPSSNTNNTSNRANLVARGTMSLNLNEGPPWNHDCQRGPRAFLPHNIFTSGHSAMEQTPAFYTSSSNVGTFLTRSSTSENYDLAGPSFGSWGSSCKRKALEGTSGQFYPGGSSSSDHPIDKNTMQHPGHGFYTTSGNLNISSSPVNSSSSNFVEQANPSSGVGMNRVSPSPYPCSSFEVEGSSDRRFEIRYNHGWHEPTPFDTPIITPLRSPPAYASSELRSSITLPTNPYNSPNQPHLTSVNESRGTHPYPWNRPLSSRGVSSSSSHRDNLDYPMTVSAPETINVLPDQVDWSYPHGSSASSWDRPSGSRTGPSAGGPSYSDAWLPHQNQTSQNHQRLSGSSPWVPSHRVVSESGTRRSHFPHLPSPSSSSDEAVNTSRHGLDQRAAAFLMDDDVRGWHSFTAVEGRHRLIRQVLSAMRRGARSQSEDYMHIDPFIGSAELHDRHRDMRLDVDNMSYEELLALEEQIGNVSTGLGEEQIRSSIKQHKYEERGNSMPKIEPCCVCQEEYATGDDVGVLDCGHEFHTGCIEQWLTLKNLCPICKITALKT